jgi:hypothetical protein
MGSPSLCGARHSIPSPAIDPDCGTCTLAASGLALMPLSLPGFRPRVSLAMSRFSESTPRSSGDRANAPRFRGGSPTGWDGMSSSNGYGPSTLLFPRTSGTRPPSSRPATGTRVRSSSWVEVTSLRCSRRTTPAIPLGRDQVQRLSRGPTISIGFGEKELIGIYESIEQFAVYDCDLWMNWRRGMPIYVARGPRATPSELSRLWERLRHYE